MDREVFLSLLALDSYNRGYGERINNLGFEPNVTMIGNATITTDSMIKLGTDAEDANFYAIAYSWNGETITSYRGTDDYNIFDPSSDIWQGWSLGAGMPSVSQGAYALQQCGVF